MRLILSVSNKEKLSSTSNDGIGLMAYPPILHAVQVPLTNAGSFNWPRENSNPSLLPQILALMVDEPCAYFGYKTADEDLTIVRKVKFNLTRQEEQVENKLLDAAKKLKMLRNFTIQSMSLAPCKAILQIATKDLIKEVDRYIEQFRVQFDKPRLTESSRLEAIEESFREGSLILYQNNQKVHRQSKVEEIYE